MIFVPMVPMLPDTLQTGKEYLPVSTHKNMGHLFLIAKEI